MFEIRVRPLRVAMYSFFIPCLFIIIMSFIVVVFTNIAPHLLVRVQTHTAFRNIFFILTFVLLIWAFFFHSSKNILLKMFQETIISTPLFWLINVCVLIAAHFLTKQGKLAFFPLVYLAGITLFTIVYYGIRYIRQ